MFTRCIRILLIICAALVAGSPIARATEEGPNGLAAKYPNDVGIASYPSVVMFLDFESKKWRRGWGGSTMKHYGLTTETQNVYGGRSALEETLVPGGTGVTMLYDFPKNKRHEKLYTRFYVKFPKDFKINSTMKFCGFGGVVPGKPTWWSIGRAGIKPTGYDKCYGIVSLTPGIGFSLLSEVFAPDELRTFERLDAQLSKMPWPNQNIVA